MPEKKVKKTRRVKNPETFREKAIKAASEESKESKLKTQFQSQKNRITTPLKKLFSKFASIKLVKKIWKIINKPLRIIGLVVLPKYIRNSWKELKLVTWPNWKTSRKLTIAVIIFAIVFGVTVAIVDFLLNKLFRDILLK